MSENAPTYLGGAEELISRWNSRRAPFILRAGDLPDASADLAPLKERLVPEEATTIRAHHGKWTAKRCLIAREFVGLSELSLLNAELIATLRRASAPAAAPHLFRRLWAEEHAHLLAQLDLRWQVSSIMTFAEHGATPAERELGVGLKMLFGLIKLYEYERLYSGQDPDQTWRFGNRSKADMPLGMDQYSLNNGGLDAALLAPLWQMAKADTVAGPLASNLLTALDGEAGTIFARLQVMKAKRAAKDAEQAARKAARKAAK